MRLRSYIALLANDLRELALSRATLFFGLALGPLVGHAFATAIATYAEMSGSPGGAGALAQGLSPLDGFVVPTLGAYAIAATLLFPFVALSLVARERESGAHIVLLQAPTGVPMRVLLKFKALLIAWIVAWLPGMVALALWRGAGGHLDTAETLGVVGGHLLHGAFVAALGIAAAAVTESAGTAAVVALAITLGAWALDFAGAVRGGFVARLAAFTPDAALRTFEHGELSARIIAVSVVIVGALLALSIIWLEPARTVGRRVTLTALVALSAGVLAPAGAMLRARRDVSEDRRNSFPAADVRALAAVRDALTVTVHLAPEDPRFTDLDRGVLRKLEGAMRSVHVDVVARSGTGLFDRDPQYGEVWYELGGRRAMQRSSTEPIVLETIYGLAGVAVPAPGAATVYPGYPLSTPPGSGAWFFFGVWPLAVLLAWWAARRRRAG